tara:strand:+ start:4854 stop:5594 length:741 start_codon:yes stop_codon:yes gene_type:complete
MANVIVYSLISVIIVSLLSLLGVFTLSFKTEQLKRFMIYMISFSAGALFGDAFIHLLPELISKVGFGLNISIYLIVGIAFSFFVEKVIHWRHCHHPTTDAHPHPFALMNLFGDAVHNFIDGIIIAASYLISIPVGFATTIAVILHEIPQEIGDFGVLIHGGFTKKKALLVNFLTALAAILGALLALALSSSIENITTFLIPFAAGTFIYVAGSDFIPELHKEVDLKKSLIQFFMFGLGVLVMIILL